MSRPRDAQRRLIDVVVRGRIGNAVSREAAAEAERIVAWLRLPAIGLIALGQGVESPNPDTGFTIVLALFTAWSLATLVWVHVRTVSPRLALAATGVDLVAFTALALLSGGAFSHVRLAFFVVPVTVAFRFRPAVTLLAAIVTTAAYVSQAFAHSAASQPGARRFIVTEAGFLAWVGLACFILSLMLARRTELVARLATSRARLLAQALSAEQRERRALAESLHDHALQNLLSARHELEDVAESVPEPALRRADEALTQTVDQLRDAVFELHPYVLEQAGLEAALRSVAQRAASQGHLALRLDLAANGGSANDQLLFSAARELLTNVVRHAEAATVTLRLAHLGDELQFVVEDDGRGFPPEQLADRLAQGHVGLASQRVRVEAAGGTMTIASIPGEGTRIEIRVPSNGDAGV
jgi:two-component system, NarL family, sensor kinase